MKNFKFIQALRPIERRKNDNKYAEKYTYGFLEEPMLVDMSAFLTACLDVVETRRTIWSDPDVHNVIRLEFAKGDRLASICVTFYEFERFFGVPWPVEKAGHSEKLVVFGGDPDGH